MFSPPTHDGSAALNDQDACGKFPFLSPGSSVQTDAPAPEPGFTYKNVQNAIDKIYDLRAKVVRIGMMNLLLYLPDPERPTTPAERDEYLLIMRTDVGHFTAIMALMETGTPFSDIHPEMACWISKLANENPAELATARRVCTASQEVLQAAEAQKNQSAALHKHRSAGRSGFHEAIVTVCEYIWADYEKDRTEDLARAKAAAKSLDTRLTRLERIGTHVRLVSLNASVEASRIGEDGRGLSLIAQEFKDLAEEVTNLAQDARGDVNRMLGP